MAKENRWVVYVHPQERVTLMDERRNCCERKRTDQDECGEMMDEVERTDDDRDLILSRDQTRASKERRAMIGHSLDQCTRKRTDE